MLHRGLLSRPRYRERVRIDVESLDEFDAHVAGTGSLAGVVVQSVDLTRRSTVLRDADVAGAIFLGCRLKPSDASQLARAGALVFPRLPDLPFDPYRPALYTPDELYRGLKAGYPATTDAHIFAWAREQLRPGGLDADLAVALHDHAITEALQQAVDEGERVVGVMGGHAQRRGTGPYRASAHLGHALADAGVLVLSGGGPGSMEAANLGASFTGSAAELDAAIDTLAAAASWSHDVTAWARSAQQVRRDHPCTRTSLGIPAWFYGHEPPNLFAAGIAKYFTNALREDALLRLCRAGLVYLPGAAGTVQEVFQAVTPNFYAADGAATVPLVLVGAEFWTESVPVWPLLHALAAGRSMSSSIHLVDGVEDAFAALDVG
jgi:predicted Rossmann-fold nucleotide-binding protein